MIFINQLLKSSNIQTTLSIIHKKFSLWFNKSITLLLSEHISITKVAEHIHPSLIKHINSDGLFKSLITNHFEDLSFYLWKPLVDTMESDVSLNTSIEHVFNTVHSSSPFILQLLQNILIAWPPFRDFPISTFEKLIDENIINERQSSYVNSLLDYLLTYIS